MRQSYKDFRTEIQEQQSKLDYSEVKEEMESNSEFTLELDKLKPQKHLWVDRGRVMSCEGAGHPNHRSFKIAR